MSKERYTPPTKSLWDELPRIVVGKPTDSYDVPCPGLVVHQNTGTGWWDVAHQRTHRIILAGVRETVARKFCATIGSALQWSQLLDMESAADFRAEVPLWLHKWVHDQQMIVQWVDPSPYMSGEK